MKLAEEIKLKTIPAAMEKYCRENEASQASLARLAGINAAYVSCIATGKTHIGDVEIADKYYTSIAQAIGLTLENSYWRHFKTEHFVQCFYVFEQARNGRVRKGIDGNTGKGKTYAAMKYKQINPTDVFVVKCKKTETVREFAIRLAKEVCVSAISSRAGILDAVCDKLKNHSGKPLLIIDEAENLKKGNIDALKEIVDALEDKVGVVVVGLDFEKILRTGAERRWSAYPQTARRFSFGWTFLPDDISNEIVKICEELKIVDKNVHNWLIKRVTDFDSQTQ